MSLGDIVSAIFRPQRKIGPFTADITIEENHVDDLVITEHPVEQGAEITDHAYKRPAQLTINCAWSNSTLSSLSSDVVGIINALDGQQIGLGTFNQAAAIYQQLLDLQSSRIPFDISTGKRNYKNMLITSIAVVTDEKTQNALFVRLACREIIIVQTQSVLLSPTKTMANPENTAQTTPIGVKQCTLADPSGSGASPPAGNGATGSWGSDLEDVTPAGS